MSVEPIGVLREAIKEVPAVKYALGAAGVAAAGAIIVYFLGYDKASAVVLGGTFIAMILLYIFATMIASNTNATTLPGIILTYAVVSFFCIFLLFTVTAFGFYWPPAWVNVLNIKYSSAEGKTLEATKPAETPKSAEELKWSDITTVTTNFPTEDRHCEHDCRNQPTKKFYNISVSAPQSADGSKIRLRKPTLNCIGEACPWATIEVNPELSYDEKSYNATVSNWGHPVLYKFTATVQKGS